MKLVDQWRTIEDGLPPGWEDVRLTLTTEQPATCRARPRCSARSTSARSARRSSSTSPAPPAPQGAQTAGASSSGSTDDRTWCTSSRPPWSCRRQRRIRRAADAASSGASVAESWDAALAPLPSDWTDLLCELEIESSTLLDRTALLCAPLNPTRAGVAPRLHLPLLGAVGLRRLALDGATLLRASRRRRNRRPDPRRPCPLRHGQRRHPGARVARGRQEL